MNYQRLLLVLALLTFAAPASAQPFFDNFLKPQYLVPVSDFPATSGGDLLLTYHQIQTPNFSNGELLIIGEFPRARYFSITAYDDHGAVIGSINDRDMVPYGASGNPYAPGGPAGAEDILYAVTIRLGAGMATNPAPSCAAPPSVHANVIDGSGRHTAGTFYSSQQSNFTANVPGSGLVTHADGAANSGVFLLIRSYDRKPPLASSQFDLRKPYVWIRDSVSGCAAQLAPAGQYLSAAQWFQPSAVLKSDQGYAHIQHEVDLGISNQWGPDPVGAAAWFGREEYVPGGAVGQYLTTIPGVDTTGYASMAAALTAQGRVMQVQFRRPALACPTQAPCALTGSEQLRYWSLSFEDATGHTLATLPGSALVSDGNGYVTLVVTFGTALPAAISAANGYSRVSASNMPLYRLVLRNYLPATGFNCSTRSVPFRTAEYHLNGGYMGDYAPVVTFPQAAALPSVAQSLVLGESCQLP
jgi:hypothetical protein